MIGSHELLLIVRAQNQASALLGRVSRDIRRMQQQRDLELRRAAVANRLQRNTIQQTREQARIESVMSDNGAQRLAHNQAISRNALQQQNVMDRIANLDVRRTGLQRSLANLSTQGLRLEQQKLRIEQSFEKLDNRRLAMASQIGRLDTQAIRNRNQAYDLDRKSYSLQTQLLERQLRSRQASAKVSALSASGGAGLADAQAMEQIARRRVIETQMSQRGLPGQRDLIGSQANDIAKSRVAAEATLRSLDGEQRNLAKTTEILTSREKALAIQLDNINARGRAVTATEAALNDQLKIVQGELATINARWQQHNVSVKQAQASLAILTEEERMLNAQLAEQNALIARQGAEQLATKFRAVSHVGRVVQISGLLGAAGLTAMALAAAHFNTEATLTATQTGAIGSGTQVIVRNAERAQKAIIDIMRAVPANQEQLNNSLYNIYSSMNTTFGQGTKLLKLFAQVWEAGGMQGDVDEVADALITLGNNWRINAGDMKLWQRLAASTLATVRFGRLTVQQYTQTMNQLAPAFHGAHQSIDQMNGAIAFMTRLMPSQRMSAAGLARFMEILGRFAAKPASGFEDLAKDIQDASGNLKPLDQIMKIFIARFPELKTSGVFLNNFIKMISNQQGTVQARRALGGLVQQNALYNQTLANTTGDQKEFNRSLKAMEQSTGVRWEQFINDMRALALEIGTAATPALLKFAKYIKMVADYFAGLSDHTKNTIATVAVFITVGGLLLGTLTAVVGMFAVMIVSLRVLASTRGFAGISKLMGGGSGAAGAAKLLAADAGAMNIRLIASMGIIGAVIALLIPFHNHLMDVVDAFGGFNTIFKITMNLLTVFTLKKVIDQLASTRIGATLATTEVVALRTQLLGLAALGAIAIPIILDLKSQYDKDPRTKTNNAAENFWIKGLAGIPVVGGAVSTVAKAGGELGRKTMDSLGWSDLARQMKKKQNESNKGFARINLSQLISLNQSIRTSASVPDYIKDMAQAAFVSGDMNTLKKIDAMRVKMSQGGTSGSATAGNKANTNSAFQGIADKQLLANVRKVSALNAAFEKAPNPTSWRAWQAALSSATKGLTADQKKMFDDLLSNMSKVDKSVKKISDSQVLTMEKNIKHLETVAKRTGALKDYIALQKAQAALEKVATSDQLSAVQAMMSAEDDLAKKRVDNAKKAADLHKQNMDNARDLIKQTSSSIQQMFESSLQTNQQQFGDLFSGRFITKSATIANRQQFGFALRPQDILKDLNTQVKDFSKFSSTIDRIAKRGAPQEMIAQLQQMGPEAQKQIGLLLKLSPQQFKQYVGAFNRGQKLIQDQTEKDVNAQLQKWNKFGKKVQMAIINGMSSANPELESAILRTVLKMFPGLAKQAGNKVPKPTTTNETHHYHINTDGSHKGVKTAITEARFQFKNRKAPLL